MSNWYESTTAALNCTREAYNEAKAIQKEKTGTSCAEKPCPLCGNTGRGPSMKSVATELIMLGVAEYRRREEERITTSTMEAVTSKPKKRVSRKRKKGKPVS